MGHRMRSNWLKLAESEGRRAGELMGESVGALAAREAARDAFRRSVIRGGKVIRAAFHQFEAGASQGFEMGLVEGERAAISWAVSADPMRSWAECGAGVVDQPEGGLMSLLTSKVVELLHLGHNHTMLSGQLRGSYRVAKEIRSGLRRVSLEDVTYSLDVGVTGFIMNGVAHLTLNGTINNNNSSGSSSSYPTRLLRGFLIVEDILGN